MNDEKLRKDAARWQFTRDNRVQYQPPRPPTESELMAVVRHYSPNVEVSRGQSARPQG